MKRNSGDIGGCVHWHDVVTTLAITKISVYAVMLHVLAVWILNEICNHDRS